MITVIASSYHHQPCQEHFSKVNCTGFYLYFDIRKHKPFGVYGYILVTFVRKVENLNKIGVKCLAE